MPSNGSNRYGPANLHEAKPEFPADPERARVMVAAAAGVLAMPPPTDVPPRDTSLYRMNERPRAHGVT